MRVLAILIGAAVLGLGVLSASSCLVDRRTTELSCSVSTDCPDGRQCTGGYCITSDAPIVPPCGTNCTDLGGTCQPDDSCAIVCTAATCPGIVECPAGLPCSITCSGIGACATGIACTSATSCTISCDGGACQAPIDCGSSACEVSCTGTQACAGEIRCNQADSCDVTCAGTDSCAALVDCGSGRCAVTCAGVGSCAGGTECASSCRCDVDCTGTGSCAAAASCGKQQCNEAPGCDSSNNGCSPSC